MNNPLDALPTEPPGEPPVKLPEKVLLVIIATALPKPVRTAPELEALLLEKVELRTFKVVSVDDRLLSA